MKLMPLTLITTNQFFMKRIFLFILTISILQGCNKDLEINSTNNHAIKEKANLLCSTIRNYQTQFSQSSVEHLQGIAFDEDFMFLSYTYKLVKKDCNDDIIAELNGNHHFGDPTLYNGFLYVPDEKGSFNNIGLNESYVYKIDPNSMTIIETYTIDETVYGIGGIAFGDNKFMIIGGNDNVGVPIINYIYEYDINFNHLKTHTYYTGNTSLGLQVIEYNELENSWITSGYSGTSTYYNFVIDNQDMLLKNTLEKVYTLNISNTGFCHIKSNDKYFLTAESTASGIITTGVYKNQPFTNKSLLNTYFIYQLSTLNSWMTSLTSNEVIDMNTNLVNEYCVSVDLKLPNGAVGSNRWAYFIAGGYDNTVTYSNYNGALVFYPQSNNGNGAFKFFIKDVQNNQAVITTPANFIISNNVHYNLAATYDGTIAKLYINGKLMGSSLAASGNIKDITDYTIGASPGGTNQFGGEVWNLSISKKLL
jgi:hypothetical protein